MTTPTGIPEVDAPDALLEALAAAFAADPDTGVFDGPPPDTPSTAVNVWVAGVEVDTDLASLRGRHGPSEDREGAVLAWVDAAVADSSPTGTRAARLAAWQRVATIRQAVHALSLDVSTTTVGAVTNRLRWTTVEAASSVGARPIEGSNGFVDLVELRVKFTVRSHTTAAP